MVIPLSQKLPHSKFEWMNEEDKTKFINKVINNQITGDEDEGYLLEVNIKYPDNKEKFTNLPLITEKKLVNDDQLSDYMKSLLGNKDNGELNRIPNEKLILDFKDKQKLLGLC